MADFTEAQREARREARRASRRYARIRKAHDRASRFTESTLTEDERSALAARDYVFHRVESDDEGLAFVAFAMNTSGARLEALGLSPEHAVNNLVRLARD